jgi:hypothetical protein
MRSEIVTRPEYTLGHSKCCTSATARTTSPTAVKLSLAGPPRAHVRR